MTTATLFLAATLLQPVAEFGPADSRAYYLSGWCATENQHRELVLSGKPTKVLECVGWRKTRESDLSEDYRLPSGCKCWSPTDPSDGSWSFDRIAPRPDGY